MDTNKMRDIVREQFEKWALGHFVNLFGEGIIEKDFGGDYVQHSVRMAWVGWKNSREAVVVDIEPDEPADEGAAYLHEDFVRSRIEAQGLKVSP